MRDKKPETFRDYGISCNWEQKGLWKVAAAVAAYSVELASSTPAMLRLLSAPSRMSPDWDKTITAVSSCNQILSQSPGHLVLAWLPAQLSPMRHQRNFARRLLGNFPSVIKGKSPSPFLPTLSAVV